MSRRVLVALNDSEHAWSALEHALEFFPGADITVLTVIDPVGAGYGQRSNDQSGEETAIPDPEQKLFEEVTELADEYGTTVDTAIEEGQAGQTIIDFAEKHGIDQIIVGTQGHSGVSRVLLGSVAETVAHQSNVSVSIIK